MTAYLTGTRKEWLAARLELLDAEKELTRRGLGRRSYAPGIWHDLLDLYPPVVVDASIA